MKKVLFAISILGVTSTFSQNIGINETGNAPDASAILDVESTDKGVLLPRVALSATNISAPVSSPATSLMVYNTATSGSGATAVTPGFYYWDGTNWIKVISGNTVSTTDDQNLTGATLSGTNLQIDIENGSSTTVNLSSLQDGTGTDSQTLGLSGNSLSISGGNSVTLTDNVNDADFVIGNEYNTGASLSGTTLSVTDGGGTQTVNLSSLQDHDWYEIGGTSQPNSINDNIYTQGSVGIGITSVPQERLEVNGNIIMSGGDRTLESATGFVGIKPNDPTYGLILRDYTGGSSVWADFRTVNAATDFLHIAVNSTSTAEGLVVSDNGNVGVRTITPHNSASLELGSTNRGFLINRSDTANISSPAFGLLTLAPTDSCLYMYSGTNWVSNGGTGTTCVCNSNLVGNGSSTNFNVDTTNLFSNSQACFSIGGTGLEVGNYISKTSDGGFVIVGTTNSYGAGSNDIYIVKLDNLGSITWTKTMGGTASDEGMFVAETNDGNIIVTGKTSSFGTSGAYLIKITNLGVVIWTKIYNNFISKPKTTISTSDGGYFLVCDKVFAKLSSSGAIQWSKRMNSSSQFDVCSSGIQTVDGGYAIVGTMNFGAFFILKVDGAGVDQWGKTFVQYSKYANSIIENPDGSFVIGATFYTGGPYDSYVVKISSNGAFIWGKQFDVNNGIETVHSVIRTNDGGYLVSGSSATTGQTGSYLIKLNSNGNLVWDKILPSTKTPSYFYQKGSNTIQLSSGDYIHVTSTQATDNGGDIFVSKLTPLGMSCCSIDVVSNIVTQGASGNYIMPSSSTMSGVLSNFGTENNGGGIFPICSNP